MNQTPEKILRQEKLDVKDQKIINIIKSDARESFQQIAKKAMISHDAASYRIKRLEKLGVIEGYSLKLNYEILGYVKYRVLLQVLENKEITAMKNYFIKKDAIIKAVCYSDHRDFMITILAKSLHELDEIITEINNKFSRIILDQEILLEVKDLATEQNTKRLKDKVSLNVRDIKIINCLLQNSRISLVELAEKTQIHINSLIMKIKSLQKRGVIEEFNTIFNFNKLGYNWYDILLLMRQFGKYEEEILTKYAKKNKNIVAIVRTIGEWNVVISILAKNPKDLHSYIKEIKTLLGNSIKDYDSLFSYEEIKRIPKIREN